MSKLGDNVKKLREARDWSQAELGRRTGMSQQAIDSIESGDTLRPRRLPELAKVLERTIDELMGDPEIQVGLPLGPVDAPSFADMPRDIPVLGTAAGGTEADFSFNGQTIDYVRRPAGIARAREIFVIYVAGNSMSPRFNEGEPVYVSRARAPAIGDDVVIELLPEHDGEPGAGYIKRLKKRTPSAVIVEQFNPPKDIQFANSRIKGVYRIMPWAELLGL